MKAHLQTPSQGSGAAPEPLISLGHRVFNLVGFQAGWFACVLGGAHGWGWMGPVVVGILAAIHLRLMSNTGGELRVMLTLAAAGAILDGTLAGLKFFSFPQGTLWLIPLWIVALWVNFAMTLNVSLTWLHSRLYLAAFLGLMAGPMAYLAGQRLGAIEFPRGPVPALVALAVIWGLGLPVFLTLAHRSRRTG